MSIDLDALTDAYHRQMVELLPEGPIYDDFRIVNGAGWKMLKAKAGTWARVHRHFADLMDEAVPWEARLTLASREAEAGLPDKCTAGRATTLPERQAAVGSRWKRVGFRHRVSDFEDLAASLGYSATVTGGRPFRCGVSRCGVDALNPEEASVVLHVVVHGPRRIPFRCGLSQCGNDPLLKIQRAEDLECMVRHLAHSHVTVIFAYEES